MVLLELDKITKVFGGLAAVRDFDLKLEKGMLSGLIGPNGAGKTTIFNMISGIIPPTNGDIFFKGNQISGCKPHELARRGIVRTFQISTLFSDLTVFQNIVLGGHNSKGLGSGFLDSFFSLKKRDELEQSTLEVIELMGLNDWKDELARNLPHGLQRILEIAIAVNAKPVVLLLDEPVAGMNWEEATRVMEIINLLRRKEGISVLLVEHNMRVVMDYCDRITVLSYGKKIAEGHPSEIKEDKQVIEAYLGT